MLEWQKRMQKNSKTTYLAVTSFLARILHESLAATTDMAVLLSEL
jgi:hypothetical protein